MLFYNNYFSIGDYEFAILKKMHKYIEYIEKYKLNLQKTYKYYFIYKIVNLINKKCYVGFHATNKEYDKDDYFGSSKTLNYAIQKYGINNFIMGKIEDINLNEWQEKERYWIKKMNAHVSLGGYNQTWGGKGTLGYSHTEETKIKIGKSSGWNRGMIGICSEETLKKMSNSHIGNKNPLFNKHHSEETKNQMSNSHMGKIFTEEHKENISKPIRGKTWEERYGKTISDQMKETRKNKKLKRLKYEKI